MGHQSSRYPQNAAKHDASHHGVRDGDAAKRRYHRGYEATCRQKSRNGIQRTRRQLGLLVLHHLRWRRIFRPRCHRRTIARLGQFGCESGRERVAGKGGAQSVVRRIRFHTLRFANRMLLRNAPNRNPTKTTIIVLPSIIPVWRESNSAPIPHAIDVYPTISLLGPVWSSAPHPEQTTAFGRIPVRQNGHASMMSPVRLLIECHNSGIVSTLHCCGRVGEIQEGRNRSNQDHNEAPQPSPLRSQLLTSAARFRHRDR